MWLLISNTPIIDGARIVIENGLSEVELLLEVQLLLDVLEVQLVGDLWVLVGAN